MNSAIDKELVKCRFEAGLRRYDKLAHVQQEICARLASLLAVHMEHAPGSILEIGAGSGFLTRFLARNYPQTNWFVNDITDIAQTFIDPLLDGKNPSYLWADAETLALPSSMDLIASASTVQWFDNLGGFIENCFAATSPGGFLALSTFGPGNFAEIRATTGEGLDYFTLQELESMVRRSGYTLRHSEETGRQLLFDTPADVLRHIKVTGVNGIRKNRWSRQTLARFEQTYRSMFAAPDSKVTLTYRPQIVIAQKI